MGKQRYKLRIPAEITDQGYFTRRPNPTRMHTAYYEVHITEASELTPDEWMAIVDKMANIGGMGNLRVEKIGEEYDTEE